MNDTQWKAIPGMLHSSGFTVSYERISYEPANPLWRASARRDGKTWSTLGRDLEAALVELETQTKGMPPDRSAMVSAEKSCLLLTEISKAN